MKFSRLRRNLPPYLAQELKIALSRCEELGLEGDALIEAERIYNQLVVASFMRSHGVNFPTPPALGMDKLTAMSDLRRAWDAIHAYREDAGAFMARDSLKLANSEIARERDGRNGGKRKSKVDEDAVVAFLQRRGYREGACKKEVIADAMNRFGCSERTIRSILKKQGLTRSKKTSAN